MIRYAATASDGSRSRAVTRESIDRWAADKCAAGCSVEVYVRELGCQPERVGQWIPIADQVSPYVVASAE